MAKYSIMALLSIVCYLLSGTSIYAEDDLVRFLEKKRIELAEKEEALKREEARLNALKREIEEAIEKYTKLLQDIEKALKKAEETTNKRLRHLAKAYEAMPPEDAATRLSGLDNATTVKILLMMNSKKAGIVMGMMEAERATEITKELARLQK